jgi:acetylornithine deacetylase/succinyl-diaminopimelate desuccinylase-like protein
MTRIVRGAVALGLTAGIIAMAATAAAMSTASPGEDAAVRDAVRILAQFAAIPSASADHAAVSNAAAWLQEQFTVLGFSSRLLQDSSAAPGGNPAVFATRNVPGTHPTVLFYLHYDTQPTGGKEDWASTGGEPFAPRLLSGEFDARGTARLEVTELDAKSIATARLYGRGTADDKAPIIMHLAALAPWLATKAASRLNLAFLLDGEEEAGSPSIDATLARYGAALHADLLLLCDGPMDALGRPSVYLGARGDMHMRLRVQTAALSGHSGNYGLLPNAAFRLTALLASMKDAQGNSVIDGWMDEVEPPTTAERTAVAQASQAESTLARHFGVRRFDGDPSLPYYERLLFRPGLIVNEVRAGRPGNQVPNTAEATLEVRLVTAQDPRQVFERIRRHVARFEAAQGWEPAAQLEYEDGIAAGRMRATDPAVGRGIRAVERAARTPLLVYPTLGGTLPLLHSFEQAGFRYVGLPLVNFDNNQHVANENIRIAVIADGIRLLGRLYDSLAAW